jgi:hypothetical protein
MIYLIFLFFYVNVARGYEDIFDEKYYAFPKDDSLMSYGYDINHVCSVINLKGDTYVGLNDAYTVFKAPYTKLQNIKNNDEIQNCFNYKAFSYIITKNGNTTTIMRGRLSRTFRLRRYDRMIFDHLFSKLYAIDGTKIYEINMKMLENFWLPQKLVKGYKNNTLDDLFSFRNNISGDNILDAIVFNNTIYFIRNEQNNVLKIHKQNIGEIKEEYVSKTNNKDFDLIPFLQISEYIENNPSVKFSLGNFSPTITIPLPSSNIKQDLSLPWTMMLYFMDVLFIIAAILVIRYVLKITKDKYDKSKKGRDVKEIDKSNDEDIFLASLPYRNIVVSA